MVTSLCLLSGNLKITIKLTMSENGIITLNLTKSWVNNGEEDIIGCM